MATTLTVTATWNQGKLGNGHKGHLGYDVSPMTVRIKFHTPATGATSFQLSSKEYVVYGGDYGYTDPGFQYLVTTESTGYETKHGTDIGSSVRVRNGKIQIDAEANLIPDRDYYVWIWPKHLYYSRVSVDKFTMTVDGTYGAPSSVGADNGFFGSQIPVLITPVGEGATHTLSVSCAGQAETLLTASPATSCVWTPDLQSFAALLPNNASATATFTCETFYGGNSVGTSTASIIVSFAQGSLPPALSAGWAQASPYNTGSAAAGISGYVKGYSKAQVQFDQSKIACQSGASIAGFRISCSGETDDTSPYFTGILTDDTDILCTVIDSRGQENSSVLHVSVLPYAAPVITEMEIFRCDSGGTADDAGQYYSAKGRVIFSSLAGENSISIKTAFRLSSAASFGTEAAMQNNTACVVGGLSADSSFVIRIRATDALGNLAEVTAALPTQHWTMKFAADGLAVGFGKAPEHTKCIELPADWVIRIGNRVIGETP